MFLKINGRVHYLWRAVDQDGDVLDILVQSRRDKSGQEILPQAAKNLALCPRALITDKLRSYRAAKAEVLPKCRTPRAEISEQSSREFTSADQIVRVLFAREIFTRFFAIAKLLKVLVARDGIEPPTPAFSGPLTESPKWFEINGCH